MPRTRHMLFHLLVTAIAAAFLCSSTVHSATYNPCKTPPVVARGTKPNVIIVQDFSGSMQFPAHSGPGYNTNYVNVDATPTYYHHDAFPNYDMTQTYYGLFDCDTYYVYNDADNTQHYWTPAATQPVSVINIASTADNSLVVATTIKITTQTPHGFAGGNLVVINGLTSNTSFNGAATTVLTATTNDFTIAGKWNNFPDKPNTGTCQKRVNGFIGDTNGVSGNILNWMSMSRMDITLKAVFGGRGTCDTTDCYLKGISTRGRIIDTMNASDVGLNNTLDRRPATLTSTGTDADTGTVKTDPDDWNTPNNSYLKKAEFVTVYGHYAGELNKAGDGFHTQADPLTSDGRYFEQWAFTLTKPTTVKMELNGSWCPSNTGNTVAAQKLYPKIYIFNAAQGSLTTLPAASLVASKVADQSTTTSFDQTANAWPSARLIWNSPSTTGNVPYTTPQTYYVVVTHQTVTAPATVGTYTLKSNVPAAKYVYPAPDTAYNLAHDGMVSIHYTGELNITDANHRTTDPQVYSKLYEQWSFTLTQPAVVRMNLTGQWSTAASPSQISIYRTPVTLNSTPNDPANIVSALTLGNPTAKLTWDSSTTAGITYPATFYVRVTYGNVGNYVGKYDLDSSVPLTKYVFGDQGNPYDEAHDGAVHGIGAIPFARMMVKVPLANRTGILQETFPFVRYGLIMFRGADDYYSDTVGKILVGCQNTDMNMLLNAYQGIGSDSGTGISFASVYPYNGTPTGDALEEVSDYLTQSAGYGNANNNTFISKGSVYDPYYDPYSSPALAPCRKTSVLVISDGEWNVGSDPAQTAYNLHKPGVDLRSDMTGIQNAKFYSLYTFDDGAAGRYAMKAIGQFGGFDDSSATTPTDCKANWPYPYGSMPGSSLTTTWPLSKCCDPASPPIEDTDSVCPANSVWNDCCREWNKNWDRNLDGTNGTKGVPDTYFEAKTGQQLEAALRSIMQDVMSRNAAASAVATVSQQTQGGDLIVRGAFEAVDPSRTGTFSDQVVWWGHLDTYWPFETTTGSGNFQYDFEQAANNGLLCYQIIDGLGTPNYNCLDFVACLNNSTLTCYTSPANRKLFTGWDANGDGRVAYATIGTTGTITRSLEQMDVTAAIIDDTTKGPYLKGLMAITTDINGDGLVNNNDYKDLINWVRGTEDPGKPFRNRLDLKKRTWPMGDVIYSTPLIVGIPSLGGVSQNDSDIGSFWSFRNTQVATLTQYDATHAPPTPTISNVIKKVVYVGANDGMVHAFVLAVWDWEEQRWCQKRDKTGNDPDRIATPGYKYAQFIGQELWAYIPTNLLSTLKTLAFSTYGSQTTGSCIHRAMVDLSPDPWYVFYNNAWHVILTGGERGGGDVHFALDVTDPMNPILLWEFSHLKNLVKRTASCTITNPDFQLPFATTATSTGSPLVASYYSELKYWPMSWSRPYVGRVNLPSGLKFYYGDPTAGSFASTKYFPLTGKRHLAFAGGGFRMFDTTGLTFADGTTVSTDLLNITREPRLVAIDIETGVDLFRYVWPWIYQAGGTALFPTLTRTGSGLTLGVPYAMADPLVLDLVSTTTDSSGVTTSGPGSDGLADTIYVGDLGGNFYSIKFNFEATSSTKGLAIDVRLTKVVTETTGVTTYSLYRGVPQPISVGAVSSYDSSDSSYVRVIVGAGKYDDAGSIGSDDKSDPARTSIYNMRDQIALPALTATSYGGTAPGGMTVYLNPKCGTNTTAARTSYFTTGCKWVNSVTRTGGTITGSTPDCCQSTCATPTNGCWQCVWDLTEPSDTAAAGERVINRGLIAGGLFFATTYVPSSAPCTTLGTGNLLIFDYMCAPFPDTFNPLPTGTTAINLAPKTGTGTIGVSVDLTASSGTGVPSAPVLDSTGKNVIVQMSNASLLKVPVILKQMPVSAFGWHMR